MRIAVTGREGQVVSCLLEASRSRPGVEVIAIGRPELDLTDLNGIADALAMAKPDLVVSAAAYTAVDQAEDEPEMARTINSDGAGRVAAAAAALAAPVIQLSTDYVFSGSQDQPYAEEDQTAPIGVYGATKLAGELTVAASNPRHLILRTAWVYSSYGKNFARTMLRLASTRDDVGVVADQWGNPTSAHDIADGLLHIAERLLGDPSFEDWGTYHLAGQGETNWSGFARRIMETSQRLGGPFARVNDISTSDYPTKARRPASSRLATGKLASTFGWSARPWQVACDDVVARLVSPQYNQSG